MAVLFISDLHLSAEQPGTTRLLLQLLEGPAREAEALYILGDLFEAWLGDDLILPEYQPVLEALRSLTESGVPVYLTHGNRDFLLGERFEALTGVKLLEEPARITLFDRPTLLLHGDLLCTDDVAYQQLRQTIRHPDFIRDFLAKAKPERITMARAMREKSREEVGTKSEQIMDVNADAVAAAFRDHSVTRIIHGHTHRPAVHQSSVDGKAVERIVLGDWGETASVLSCTAEGCQLERWPAHPQVQ